jgi:YidC/Oxa1 family membrane protein insertase
VDILISPLVNMLLVLYGVLGHSFVLAIIVATILIRLVTLPLTLPQQRNSRKMAELAPQLEELKKKHGNDRNKYAQAQMELYKENKINMFGGCLPLILQLVIMIAFYQALTGSLATNPLQLQQLSHRVLPGLIPLIPINPIFMIYDLGLPGVLPIIEQNASPIVAQLLIFILPALVVATTYLSQKFMAAPSADPSQASMTRQMNIIMPMMFGLFALQFASGLSIYFIVSNLVGWAGVDRGAAGERSILVPAPSSGFRQSKASNRSPHRPKAVVKQASKPLKRPVTTARRKTDWTVTPRSSRETDVEAPQTIEATEQP